MKMNKWTVGLAAAGVVSLSSVAQAQEAAANAVQTKLATTSLSGYISTSYNWVTGDNTGAERGWALSEAENDGFGLDVVSLSLGSPMGSGEWATGYNVQLWLGEHDLANGDLEQIKNAYVELRVPVGSGLDLQVGQFDTIIGYEGIDFNTNPFYSHSWGFALEPTLHTGVKGTYQVADEMSVSALIANKLGEGGLDVNTAGDQGDKTYGLAATIGAPDSFGSLADAELTVGYIKGNDNNADAVQNFYVGASIPTPIENLSAGIAWDVRKAGTAGQSDSALGLYLAYKVNDQLTTNLRIERVDDGPSGDGPGSDAWDFTLGANYALWDGVITRAEWRTTILDTYTAGSEPDQKTNSLMLNMIYEF